MYSVSGIFPGAAIWKTRHKYIFYVPKTFNIHGRTGSVLGAFRGGLEDFMLESETPPTGMSAHMNAATD